ncbi:DUF1048 domain-containing protein [Shimazuella sp. AN120528]|uniref:DUF1048 domain-containing protein n=1 Tax=Shimazuella soli TaxID=1892854 RepID=UPI001F0F18F2|nr:DUF1048 domain-containing protein [Shimazuella soli]MCH5585209.1 DUF1048 domain-containing protein [Shimazuella soli]
MENIFTTLNRWKKGKAEYKRYKKRMNALPSNYQTMMKEIEHYLWTFESGADDGMGMIKILTDVVKRFESNAQEGKDVLDAVGQDISGFCDDLLKDVKTETWEEQRKKQLNQTIYKRLRRA